MIWQNGRHESDYFYFHDGVYVMLKSAVTVLCLFISVVLYWKITNVIRATPRSRHGDDKPSISATELSVNVHGHKSSNNIAILVRPCLLVTIITCLVEVPLCLFEIINCQYGPRFNMPNADILLFYLHLIVFVRSLVCCFVIVLYVPELRLLLVKYFGVCSLEALKPCCRPCENSASFDLPVRGELSPDSQSQMEVHKIEMRRMTSIDTLSSVVDASVYSCSQYDSLNHLSPSTPNTHLPATQGSSIQGPSIQESSIQGSSIQESSIQQSSIQGPSIQGSSVQRSSIAGPSIPEPPLQEATTSTLKLPVNTRRIFVPNTHLPVTCISDLDKPLLVQKSTVAELASMRAG